MLDPHLHLIKWTLDNYKSVGISIWDGEEIAVENSRNKQDIVDAINSVEICELLVLDGMDRQIAWFMVVPSNNKDSIADYSITDFTEKWSGAYGY